MRGTHANAEQAERSFGIIPAHAGNTLRTGHRMPEIRDHPRACGEHHDLLPHVLRVAGSSPRMRGTPRGCCKNCKGVGSSPRMRGTHVLKLRVDGGDGIIPAHAGNTSISSMCLLNIRDHPRACGEHYTYDSADITGMGSSPRMRGTHAKSRYADIIHRIIPAHAGNTCE